MCSFCWVSGFITDQADKRSYTLLLHTDTQTVKQMHFMQWRDFFRAETIKLIINTNEIRVFVIDFPRLFNMQRSKLSQLSFSNMLGHISSVQSNSNHQLFYQQSWVPRYTRRLQKKSIKEPWSMKTGLLTNENPSFVSVRRGWMFPFGFITTSSPSNEQEMSTKYLFQCELYEKIRIPSFIYRKCIHCCNESSNL